MSRLIFFVIIFFFLTGFLFSQNIVKNGGFEILVKKKPKDLGEITKSLGWSFGTLEPADFFTSLQKKGNISVPYNYYGDEKARTGDNYAGFTAFSYRDKFKRSYLKTMLFPTMEAGKKYCVRFYVSLADLSKYAVSHLGVHFSDANVNSRKSTLLYVTHVKSINNDVYSKQYNWVPVCGTYTATGEENYMIIGNFTDNDSLIKVRVKRPKGYTRPQIYKAYYYVDDVSIKEVVGNSDDCFCEMKKGIKMAKVVKKIFKGTTKKPQIKIIGTREKIVPKVDKAKEVKAVKKVVKIDKFKLNFSKNQFALTSASKSVLDKVTQTFKFRKSAKVYLYGAFLGTEDEKKFLDVRRTAFSGKYLMSKGVPKTAIVRKHFKATPPPKFKDKGVPTLNIEVK